MAEQIRKMVEAQQGGGGAAFGRAPIEILRRKQVETQTGLSRSTLYDYIRAGRFPPAIRLGSRAVGWVASEVDAWLAAQVERSRKSA